MNYDLIFAVIFYSLIYLFYLKHKKKFEIQNKIFALYKTKIGIKLMDRYAKKFPRILNFLAYISIIMGFLGMIFILYTIIQGTYKLIADYFIGAAVKPVLAPVLPGVAIPGLPTLGFWHWIIAIFAVAVIHEFSHGVYARLYNLKIKSSGFAFLGPILAAFVEPDEKALVKKSKKEQLAILSAGPFSNILLAIIILLIFNFIFIPLQSNWFVNNGISIVNIEKDSPAELAQLKEGFIIKEINNEKINDQRQLPDLIQKSNGENIKMLTDKGEFTIKPYKKDDKFHVGISVTNLVTTKDNVPDFVLDLTKWINMLLFWLWVVSLGIGLFNLLPLGPIDGGRMFYTAMLGLFNEKKARNLFKYISAFCLLLIFINLLPYLAKLFNWIINILSKFFSYF
jgi:membrane-associated protease RseP (regulator of RpoE activity)